MTNLAIACALALAPVTAGTSATIATGSHPAGVDVYVELPDLAAVEKAYGSAPLAKFCSDADVLKLSEVLATFGADVPAIVKRGLPRLSADPASSACSMGELRAASLSIHGIDRQVQDPPEFEKRVEILIDCEFASEAGAARMSQALVDAAWLSTAPATSSAGDNPTQAPTTEPKRTIEIGGKRVDVSSYRWSAFGVSLDAWTVRSGSRWWLGAGRASPDELAERLAGKRPSQASGDALFGSAPSATPANGVLVARLHSDLASIPSFGVADDSPWIGALISALVPFAGATGDWRLELRGERFVTEAHYVTHAAPTLYHQLVGDGPLAVGSADYVPPEAVGAWLFPLRADAAKAVLNSVLPGSNTKSAADATDAATKERQERIAANLSKALGTKASLALLPFAGISPLPRVLASVELRDRAALDAALTDIEAQIKSSDSTATVSRRTYHKVPMIAFSQAGSKDEEATGASAGPLGIPMGDPTASARPTIAVLDDRVIVGLASSYVRTEIQRLEKKSGDNAPKHLLAAEGRVPADALEASSMDWGGLLGKVYDMARGFAPMLAQQQTKLTFDPAQLPAAAKLMRFFAPSTSFTRRLPDGSLFTHSESSFGPEMFFVIGAAAKGIERGVEGGLKSALDAAEAPGAQTQRDAANGAHADPHASDAKPAPIAPPRNVEREASLSALRSVKTGIAVYKAQSGSYPARLATLIEPTTDFPKGFLDTLEIPKDGWNHELRYELDTAAATFRLWSVGADGVDQAGAGDDIVLP